MVNSEYRADCCFCEIITQKNLSFFRRDYPMDKVTHKVRCERWTRIINECLVSGMKKPLGAD